MQYCRIAQLTRYPIYHDPINPLATPATVETPTSGWEQTPNPSISLAPLTRISPPSPPLDRKDKPRRRRHGSNGKPNGQMITVLANSVGCGAFSTRRKPFVMPSKGLKTLDIVLRQN